MGPKDESEDTRPSFFGETQSSEGQPYLIVLMGPAAPRMFRLLTPRTVIGRSSASDIVLDDESVSRSQCEIVFHHRDDIQLKDLGSTNGTFVNGVKVAQAQLHDGDRLQFGGSIVLKLTLQDLLDQQYQEALYDAATRDPLTKTFNRRVLNEQLRLEFVYFRRKRNPLSLCLFDIDHFKEINDSHGHQAGDEVLAGVASLIARQLRAPDVFARYGGEEFAAVLRDCGPLDAPIIGERIRAAIEQAVISFTDKDRKPGQARVTVSIGIATLCDDRYASHTELIAAADKALYEAKGAGRNHVRIASD